MHIKHLARPLPTLALIYIAGLASLVAAAYVCYGLFDFKPRTSAVLFWICSIAIVITVSLVIRSRLLRAYRKFFEPPAAAAATPNPQP